LEQVTKKARAAGRGREPLRRYRKPLERPEISFRIKIDNGLAESGGMIRRQGKGPSHVGL